MIRTKSNPYFDQKILSADPIELVRLLYGLAISSVKESRVHLADGRIMERGAAINRAYAAIAELQGSLRPDAAPELAARLQGLYTYMQQRLVDANLRQSDAPLAEAQSLLLTLAEAWDGVSLEDRVTEIGEPGGSATSEDRDRLALVA